MIIDKNVLPYTVNKLESIRAVLNKIDQSKQGHILVVNQDGLLLGITTDVDIRRWLINQENVDLSQPIETIINRSFVFAYFNQDLKRIESKFTDGITFIPLVDDLGRLMAVAKPRGSKIVIGHKAIGEGEPAFVIAEIGNNHNGNVDLAKKLVDLAIEAGADCVKFQLRDMDSLYATKGGTVDTKEDLGSQYTLDLLNRFNLSAEQMFGIFDYCREKGILFFCTPWDLKSLEKLENYGVPAYKIGSPDLTNHELLLCAAKTLKPIICSVGMSTEEEIKSAVNLLRNNGAQFALLHCNSTYPTPFKDINLYYLKSLMDHGCPVGYSGHERGYSIPIAAVALGAKIIEKHFTIDREMEGNDHRVSLLPEEFSLMVKGIREVEMSLGKNEKNNLSQGELMNREILGKSLIMNCDLKKGQTIDSSMISIKGPGKGLPPYRKNDVIGKIAQRDYLAGEFIYPADIGEILATAKTYSFRRPWGIPVRYHDFEKVVKMSNMDLLEFHFSYRDLEEDVSKYFSEIINKKLLVHAPELFAGDHLLDLSSLDENYRQESVKNLQKVIDVTRKIKIFFKGDSLPMIITHIGGATLNKVIAPSERAKRYENLLKSLNELDKDGVEIVPETMPPLPWHFGGQRYHNLFVDPDEVVAFCKENNYRLCFDVAHSKLACNYYKWSYKEFIEKVAPHTVHCHISDASGVDGEGLQIEDGEIDFKLLAELLDLHCPNASFITEIWQGHKDDCRGFWHALSKLEKWF